MIDTFRATHCGQTFEGAEGAAQIEKHMKAHRAEPGKRGQWFTPRPQPSHKPTPWKAPKAPADTQALTAVLAGADARELLEWHTDESAVPVGELKAGDVFMWGGRTYTLEAVGDDTVTLSMKRKGAQPERTGTVPRSNLDQAGTVTVIKRAA